MEPEILSLQPQSPGQARGNEMDRVQMELSSFSLLKLPQVPAELLLGRPSTILSISHCPARVVPEGSFSGRVCCALSPGTRRKVHCAIAPSPPTPTKGNQILVSLAPFPSAKLGLRMEGGSNMDAGCVVSAKHWVPTFHPPSQLRPGS